MDLNIESADLHDEVHLEALLWRKLGPEEFRDAVLPSLEGASEVEVEEVGRFARGERGVARRVKETA